MAAPYRIETAQDIHFCETIEELKKLVDKYKNIGREYEVRIAIYQRIDAVNLDLFFKNNLKEIKK